MKLPRSESGAERVLSVLWERGRPMPFVELAAAADVTLDNLTRVGRLYKLRTNIVGVYALPESYNAHFNPSAPQEALLVAESRTNTCWSKPMTGYTANLSRYIGRQA